jgi:hypothetical protein
MRGDGGIDSLAVFLFWGSIAWRRNDACVRQLFGNFVCVCVLAICQFCCGAVKHVCFFFFLTYIPKSFFSMSLLFIWDE